MSISRIWKITYENNYQMESCAKVDSLQNKTVDIYVKIMERS